MRVPFIASWVIFNENASSQKKIPFAQNTIQQQMGSIFDIFPTLYQVTNVHTPEGFAIDQLIGKQNEIRDAVFLNHFSHGNHHTNYFTSLIELDWNYQVNKEPRYELFTLKKDSF